METTLLATKLFIPPVRPGLVSRTRLLQKLNETLSRSLALISAPAGFGKTTLLAQWIHSAQPPIPTGWLSLEETENDPARFWDYFIAAVKSVHPTAGDESLPLLHSSQPVPIESTLTLLINDLATVSGDLVLVLDDYHFIQSPAVLRGLTFFLEHMPPQVHVVIATRTDPSLPLAGLRGRGALHEIRAADLRFSAEEAAALLTGADAPVLSGEQLRSWLLR